MSTVCTFISKDRPTSEAGMPAHMGVLLVLPLPKSLETEKEKQCGQILDPGAGQPCTAWGLPAQAPMALVARFRGHTGLMLVVLAAAGCGTQRHCAGLAELAAVAVRAMMVALLRQMEPRQR